MFDAGFVVMFAGVVGAAAAVVAALPQGPARRR